MSSYSLTHLRQLEAESIHIIREVVAEFENPVMLYSIGKDSSVMLHLARKAFRPFPDLPGPHRVFHLACSPLPITRPSNLQYGFLNTGAHHACIQII